MTISKIQPKSRSPGPAATVAVAWVMTLAASALVDILWFELTGSVPSWIFWVKAGLLGAMVGLGFLGKTLRPLVPYFLMLLAFTALMQLLSWIQELPAWTTWQTRQSFAVAALSFQVIEMGVALLLVGVLFILRKRRENFFLVRGDLKAVAEPVRWWGQRSPSRLWEFGLIFTLVVIVCQVFMLILPLSPSAATLQSLVPLIPLILLLAVSNGFNEEIILRAAPIAPVFEAVGKSHAIWMAALLFGLAHYIGGIPSGIPGVLITTFLGWFFGKCMLDSKGFFWPWLFHAIQDILPFAFMTLTTLSRASG